jgi:uncharacterized protein involved in exopolysaccharide biosynthesis
MTIVYFLHILRRYWVSFAAIVIICTLLAFFLGLILPVQYRAKMSFALAPPPFTEQLSGSSQGLGALGKLAGISGIGQTNLTLNFQKLKSRSMIRYFLTEKSLISQINLQYSKMHTGKVPSTADIEKAVDIFKKDIALFSPSTDNDIYTMEVEYTDPNIAARLVNDYVNFADSKLRIAAIADTQGRLNALTGKLGNQQLPEVRTAIASLIAQETRTLALISGTPEYAFKIVDAASIPYKKSSPLRALIALLGFSTGLVLACLMIIFRGGQN